jgi:hypothetical protein
MRAIIMCDGRAIRWYNDIQNQIWGNRTKQLVEVDGEPILHRTVRLLHENGIEDIWITSHKEEHEVEGATRFEPECNFDKFYAAKGLWKTDGVTLFLYGDVFYTKKAIREIIELPVNDFLFFGRFAVSSLTGHGGEIYAVKICRESGHVKFREAVLLIYVWKEIGRGKNSAWEILRYMNGARGNDIYEHTMQPNFVEIDDLTDDFDTPEHYLHWLEIYRTYKEQYG